MKVKGQAKVTIVRSQESSYPLGDSGNWHEEGFWELEISFHGLKEVIKCGHFLKSLSYNLLICILLCILYLLTISLKYMPSNSTLRNYSKNNSKMS